MAVSVEGVEGVDTYTLITVSSGVAKPGPT